MLYVLLVVYVEMEELNLLLVLLICSQVFIGMWLRISVVEFVFKGRYFF